MNANYLAPVFFDASCLTAAAGSPQGGSGFLLAQCRRGFLIAAVSESVMVEAERNVVNKMDAAALANYEWLVVQLPKIVIPAPSPEQLLPYRGMVTTKDQHVVAAAILARASVVLTLDKELAQQVSRSGLSLYALSPGEFINTILIHHPDYPHMRK